MTILGTAPPMGHSQKGDTDFTMTKSAWDSYLAAARERYEIIDESERYKLVLADKLRESREALLHGYRGWPKLVRGAVRHKDNNIIYHLNQSKLMVWVESNVAEARDALSAMWSHEDRTTSNRIRSFDDGLPASVFPRTAVGTRLNVAAYLMMGIDPQRYPPYQKKLFEAASRRLGHPASTANDVAGEYEHFIAFLERVLHEVQKRGMDRPRTRLDAQSVVWHLQRFESSRQPSRKPTPQPVSPPRLPPPVPVRHPLNTILYGPPGTGKTWHTVNRAVAIVENREVDEVKQENRSAVKDRFDEYRRAEQVEMVTFHQNTTYEDFVEGIRPVLTDPGNDTATASSEHSDAGDVRYEMSQGVFRRMAKRAADDTDKRYVLIIDEINRGNIARIFGELITLIEDSKRVGKPDEARVTLPGSKTDFGVPANLHVLGTMNTADRSIALLDTALRRRFVFEEMMPDPSHRDIATDVDGVNCRKLLSAINRRIAVLLDREHQIGHTYFMRVDTLEALSSTFRHRIMPLLQEYFYDDWEKIRAVLNAKEFVRKLEPPPELVRRDLVDSDRSVYDLEPADHSCWLDPAAYRKIYETARADGGDVLRDSDKANDADLARDD